MGAFGACLCTHWVRVGVLWGLCALVVHAAVYRRSEAPLAVYLYAVCGLTEKCIKVNKVGIEIIEIDETTTGHVRLRARVRVLFYARGGQRPPPRAYLSSFSLQSFYSAQPKHNGPQQDDTRETPSLLGLRQLTRTRPHTRSACSLAAYHTHRQTCHAGMDHVCYLGRR